MLLCHFLLVGHCDPESTVVAHLKDEVLEMYPRSCPGTKCPGGTSEVQSASSSSFA